MGKHLAPGVVPSYLHTGLGGGCLEGGATQAALGQVHETAACLCTVKFLPP